MNILIKYCGMWGYKSKAQDVADEILDKYNDLKVFLEVGHGGQFDIIYEIDPPGLLFSKDVTDRFPEPGEIIEIMEKYNGKAS